MFALLLALLMLAAIGFGGILFLGWLIREHHHANQYRQIARLQAMTPYRAPVEISVPGWKITYKEKGKTDSVTIPVATEGEALSVFLKTYGGRTIVSSVRV